MTEGMEKAFMPDLAPDNSKAAALGFYHCIIGTGLFPASIIAGILFSFLPGAPFFFGGIMSLATICGRKPPESLRQATGLIEI